MAHRLGGSVAYLAAEEASEALRRVDEIGRSGEAAKLPEAFREVQRQVGRLQEALAPHRGRPEPRA